MVTIDNEDGRDVVDERGTASRRETAAAEEPEVALLSYEEGAHLVVCDRRNPRAWIRTDAVRPLDDMR